jgi:2-dehydro-3-deoxygluconokinase
VGRDDPKDVRWKDTKADRMRIVNVLSIGEVMVEFFSANGGPCEFRTSFGGDTFTVAAMAARLGASSSYLTAIGRDIFCEFLLDGIRATGVGINHIQLRPGYNGIYFITVDKLGERHFQYYRSGSSASMLSPSDLPISVLDTADILYTSGVTSALSESTADLVCAALKRSHSLGRITAYDLNFRARLWTEERAIAQYRSVLRYVSHLFLSEIEVPILAKSLALSDIADLASKDAKYPIDVAGLAHLAEACFRAGISEMVIKFGAAGALLATCHAPQLRHLRAWKCQPVDSTGAGDAFNGAYLASRYMQGFDPLQAATWATAAAGLKVTRRGSVCGLPTGEEIETVYHQLCMEPS